MFYLLWAARSNTYWTMPRQFFLIVIYTTNASHLHPTLHLQILLVIHGNKELSSDSVVSGISLNNLAHLERTRLDNTTSDRTTETVGTVSDAEVGDWDLVWVAVDDGWGAVVGGVDKVVCDL